MSFCPFLIVWGSCSNSINSHSLWWLVPLHWWPGGHTLVCSRCSEVAHSCNAWMKIQKRRSTGSVVGHVWLYTLTAGGIKIKYSWCEKQVTCCNSKRNTMSPVYQAKIQDLLITSRHGLISQWNGWCYHLCQICNQQEGAGNRISIIVQICAHWLAIGCIHVPLLALI